jgi:rhamnosyltransferase
MTSRTGVCAVVVAYYPGTDFQNSLDNILPQVDALVVVDNTSDGTFKKALEVQLAEVNGIHFVANPTNLGVAVALNQGLNKALQIGCDWLLTLDQDSQCYPDMVQTLLSVKAACVPQPAVIGGNYLDPRNKKTRVPLGTVGEFFDQKTVITSGCLVEVNSAQNIGGFREDYFIDQLDHEFCLRVRAHGGRVVISRKPVMEHSVGETDGAWLPLLGYLPNHSAPRKYYVARNSLVTIARYWRTEPDWCLRRLIRLTLGFFLIATLERQRLAKVRAFVAGVVDAVMGRMGKCGHNWLELARDD